jgi:hypothetical protein
MTTFNDAFTRADAGTLGANWSVLTGYTNGRIVSNQAAGPTSGECMNYVATATATFGADQYAQAVISGMTSSSVYCGVGVRMSGGNGYVFNTDGVAGATDSEIAKITGGSYAALKAIASSFANGDTIKLVVSGTTNTLLQLYKNGVLVDSYTDSTSPFTSGQPGIEAFGSNARVDDFTADDGGGGGGGVGNKSHMDGVALSGISAIDGVSKAGLSAITRIASGFKRHLDGRLLVPAWPALCKG